jgi:tRNA (guanine26-N2/guanine27-N2)-dimethyltransferase
MATLPVEVPEGFKLHTENKAKLLLAENEAFLNPVQEFNRDLSVACIKLFSEELDTLKEQKWRLREEAQAEKASKKLKSETRLLQELVLLPSSKL